MIDNMSGGISIVQGLFIPLPIINIPGYHEMKTPNVPKTQWHHGMMSSKKLLNLFSVQFSPLQDLQHR